MRRTAKRLRLCTVLLAANVIFIWGNSALPGAVSQAVSDWIAGLLGMIPQGPDMPSGAGVLRKIAHFAEFACLGLLLTWFAGMKGERGFHLICTALLGGLLTACVDESIQLLAMDRGSSLVDVWIDLSGVVSGVILLLIGRHLLTKITKIRI